MKKINIDITYREIYQHITKRESIEFIANRTDIGFENIEKEIESINFDIPFRLPIAQDIDIIIKMLLNESIGTIEINPSQKLKLLTKVFNGELFYIKINNGDEWKIIICF